jgi:hypothetical protein
MGTMIASLMAAKGYNKTGRKKSIILRAYTRLEFLKRSNTFFIPLVD